MQYDYLPRCLNRCKSDINTLLLSSWVKCLIPLWDFLALSEIFKYCAKDCMNFVEAREQCSRSIPFKQMHPWIYSLNVVFAKDLYFRGKAEGTIYTTIILVFAEDLYSGGKLRGPSMLQFGLCWKPLFEGTSWGNHLYLNLVFAKDFHMRGQAEETIYAPSEKWSKLNF